MSFLLRSLISLAAAMLLVACSDSSSTGSSGDSSLEGTWNSYDAGLMTNTYSFDGSKFSYSGFQKKCLVSQSDGSYTFDGAYLHLVASTIYTRPKYETAPDSATVCSTPLSQGTISGTMPIKIESRTSTSFTTVTYKISITSSGSTTTEIRTLYTKQ